MRRGGERGGTLVEQSFSVKRGQKSSGGILHAVRQVFVKHDDFVSGISPRAFVESEAT